MSAPITARNRGVAERGMRADNAGPVDVVCLLPARNCADDLPSFFEAVEPLADAVVALDDGSTDGTLCALEAYPLVKVVLRNPPRDTYFGWDDATNRQRLLDAAADLRPRWIISIDADERIPQTMPTHSDDFSTHVPTRARGSSCRSFAWSTTMSTTTLMACGSDASSASSRASACPPRPFISYRCPSRSRASVGCTRHSVFNTWQASTRLGGRLDSRSTRKPILIALFNARMNTCSPNQARYIDGSRVLRVSRHSDTARGRTRPLMPTQNTRMIRRVRR